METQFIIFLKESSIQNKRKMNGNFITRFVLSYHLQTCHMTQEVYTLYETDIYDLQLPISNTQLQDVSEKQMQKLYDKIQFEVEALEQKQSQTACVFMPKAYKKQFRSCIVPFHVQMAFFHESASGFLKRKQISFKQTRIVILDNQDADGLKLVQALCGKINFLTIVTKRKDIYIEVIKEIFEDSGLIVTMQEEFAVQMNIGIVINYLDVDKILYRNIAKGSLYLDMAPSVEKKRLLTAKRKDVTYADTRMFLTQRKKVRYNT